LKLKKIYYLARDYFAICKKDFNANFPLPFLKRLYLIYRGFLSEKYALYDFEINDYKDYLSDIQSANARWINNPYIEILSNKFLFERVVGQFIKVPKTFALINQGFILFVDSADKINQYQDIFQLLLDTSIILKPVTGGGGAGVIQLENREGQIYIDDFPVTSDKLIDTINELDGYVVSERLNQGSFPLSLNNQTINCMRVVTIYDNESNEAFIIGAAQRIGVKKSYPFDNFTRGGLSSNIDLDSGILSSATSHPTAAKAIWYDSHPETDVMIKGRVINEWLDIKHEVLTAANKMPYLKCIGWDILLTDSGIYAIEGNHHPDPDVLQCHQGILKNERVRKFYKEQNIVK